MAETSGEIPKTWKEKQRGPRKMTRRKFLKRGGLAAAGFLGAAILGPPLGRGISSLGKEEETTPKEGEYGRVVWVVRKGETMSSIGARFYPDFYSNQPYYEQILRQANLQDPKRNLYLYPGQQLYIPDPQRPTYGLGLGEEAVGVKFKSAKEVVGEVVVQIEIQGQVANFPSSEGMKVGQEFVAPSKSGELRRYHLAAYLPGMPEYQVPGRIVFEQAKLPAK